MGTKTIITKRLVKITTIWIWTLHADIHDFIELLKIILLSTTNKTKYELSQKVFSSNFTHLSILLIWISGMHFHGAYFSNYSGWIKEPFAILPISHYIWEVISQNTINVELGKFNQRLYITSGLFNVWITQGITNINTLKEISSTKLSPLNLISLAAYYHM